MLENKRNVYIIILLLYCNEYNYYYNYNIIHLQTYKQDAPNLEFKKCILNPCVPCEFFSLLLSIKDKFANVIL